MLEWVTIKQNITKKNLFTFERSFIVEGKDLEHVIMSTLTTNTNITTYFNS